MSKRRMRSSSECGLFLQGHHSDESVCLLFFVVLEELIMIISSSFDGISATADLGASKMICSKLGTEDSMRDGKLKGARRILQRR